MEPQCTHGALVGDAITYSFITLASATPKLLGILGFLCDGKLWAINKRAWDAKCKHTLTQP
jgi:hypothetical protein